MAWEEVIPDKEDTSVSVRLEVHTLSAKEAVVYLTMVPMSKERLVRKCEQWEVSIDSDRVPVALLPWGEGTEVKKGSIPTVLMVQEKPDWKCGFGIIGLLEQVLVLFDKKIYPTFGL